MAEDPQAAVNATQDADAESGAAAIARVATEILPALIARLEASELGELEVAQEGWRVRLRRDAGASGAQGASASQGGHPGAGAPGGGGGGQHAAGSHSAGSHSAGSQGTGSHGTASHAAPAAGSGQGSTAANRSSVVRRAAISPAVGYFTARDGLSTGQAVRAGDVLGVIDVLGVTQPVVAPTDGVVGRILASAGEAVEYGQELVRIDGIERLVES